MLGPPVETAPEKESELKKVAEHTRGKAKKNRPDDCTTESGLRFNDDVPVEIIDLTPDELKGESAKQYKVITTKITRKLAQLPASYVVLEYHRPVYKKINTGDIRTTLMPDQVLESSVADVSLLVGLLIDKFFISQPIASPASKTDSSRHYRGALQLNQLG